MNFDKLQKISIESKLTCLFTNNQSFSKFDTAHKHQIQTKTNFGKLGTANTFTTQNASKNSMMRLSQTNSDFAGTGAQF